MALTAPLFDKSRGVGGRTSTRRKDNGALTTGQDTSQAQTQTSSPHQNLQPWQPTESGEQILCQALLAVMSLRKILRSGQPDSSPHTTLAQTITSVPRQKEAWLLTNAKGGNLWPL